MISNNAFGLDYVGSSFSNPFAQFGFDHTGYGPTGIGNAPTDYDMRRQSMNRFRSDRLSTAMQYIDPYVTAAGTAAQQIVAKANSPAAARRSLYNSAGGQAALDGVMFLRQSGMLGQGNPINYAHNIVRGISGGGFNVSYAGSDEHGRRVTGPNQRVSGNGALAERVSMNYAKGLIEDLYGKGTPDPAKLHGFDMEEASQIFATIARRGGVGEAATVVENADVATRLKAAVAAAVDPTIKEGLAKAVKAEVSTDEELADLIATTTDDKKLNQTLKDVSKSTSAVFANNKGRRDVAKVVEAVTDGLASLTDIYGDLKAPELMQKLEAVSGMRIGTRQQAKQAKRMVEDLRGAAEISGMDPYAFMQYSAAQQASLQGQVAQTLGMDGRSSTKVKGITAGMHQTMIMEAALSGKSTQIMAREAQQSGFGDTRGAVITMDEAYDDKRQGRLQFMGKYKALTMAMGGVDNLSGTSHDRAQEILTEFKGTTDAGKREDLEYEMQSIFSSAYSRPGAEVDFNAVLESRSGQDMLANTFRSRETTKEFDASVKAGRTAGLNAAPLANKLLGDGVGGDDSELGADRISRIMVENTDLGAMTKLLNYSKDETLGGPEEQRKHQMDVMKQAGLSDDEGAKFLDSFFGDDGKVKDEAQYIENAKLASTIDWEGNSIYSEKGKTRDKLDAWGAGSRRVRIRAEDQTVNFNSIVTSMATGKSEGVNDHETMAYALQALSDEDMAITVDAVDVEGEKLLDDDGNIRQIDMKGSAMAGEDFSKGLNKDLMDKLKGVNKNQDLELWRKAGYSSQEEMFEQTQASGDERLHTMNVLAHDPDYTQLNINGRMDNVTAIHDEAYDSFKKNGMPNKIFSKVAAAERLGSTMSEGELKNIKTQLKKGGKMDLSLFEADEFDGKVKGKHWYKSDDDYTHARLGNMGRFRKLAGLVRDSEGEDLAGLARLNEDGGLGKQMDAQLKSMRAAHADGANTANFRDFEGKERSTPLNKEVFDNFQALIDKLTDATNAEKGIQHVGEMVIQGNLHVEGPEGIVKK